MILTIGTFDGVHLGHQAILQSVDAVVTFSNHPQTVLQKETPETLNSLSHKLFLIKEMGVKRLHVLPFTEKLSQMSPEAFLLKLREIIPYTHLLLGHDAAIGQKRSGTPKHLFDLSEKLGFILTYLEPQKLDGKIISSSLIRHLISEGDLEQAERFLGRPYSILSTVKRGVGKGRSIGYCTANIELDHLCLPPNGVYAISARFNGKCHQGIANLGFAPTLQNRKKAILETHLFEFQNDLYGMDIEIIFKRFIRPEKRFSSVEELKIQIKKDILCMKKKNDVSILDDVITPLST